MDIEISVVFTRVREDSDAVEVLEASEAFEPYFVVTAVISDGFAQHEPERSRSPSDMVSGMNVKD